MRKYRIAFAAISLAITFRMGAFAAVSEDWEQFYKWAGPSVTPGQAKSAWKYKVKLIFDIFGKLENQHMPVRTTADGKAFCAIAWSHLGKGTHSWTVTAPPTPLWYVQQQGIRRIIESYLRKANMKMTRRYVDALGIKSHGRYTYEWREGDCIVRLTEAPGIQTTLSFFDVTDIITTDFKYLEHPMTDTNSNDPVAAYSK